MLLLRVKAYRAPHPLDGMKNRASETFHARISCQRTGKRLREHRKRIREKVERLESRLSPKQKTTSG